MNSRTRVEAEQRKAQLQSEWNELQLANQTKRSGLLSLILRLIEDFDIFSSYIYRARQSLKPNDFFRIRLEESAADFSQNLHALSRPEKGPAPYDLFKRRYRQIWKTHFSLFLLTFIFFFVSALLGWLIVYSKPEYASVIVPQRMLEDVLEKKRWFDSLQKNPLMMGIQIAFNNIRVAINTVLLSSLLGIGGLYLLVFNGLLLGCLLAFCRLHQFDAELGQFVVGHGALEITILIASCFGGLLFGRLFYQWPWKNFRKRMAAAGRDAGTVLLGVCPWLILAATVEAFISPWPWIPLPVRLTISTSIAAAFWIWTFWPEPPYKRTDSRIRS